MATYPKKLTWNPKQVAIYEALKSGASQHQIAKDLGANIAVVGKVNNALKKGQSPSDPYVAGAKKKTSSPIPKTTAEPHQEYLPITAQAAGPSCNATLLNLKPVAVDCAITPIMLIARSVAIKEFGWPEDVSWEDFFDTVLRNLFRRWGFVLQEYYKLDELDKLETVTK